MHGRRRRRRDAHRPPRRDRGEPVVGVGDLDRLPWPDVRRPEAQRTGRGAGRVEGVVDGDDRGPSTIPERPSGRGEPEVVGAALDETDARVCLELLEVRDSAGCVRCSRAAARVMFPSSAMATNARRWRSSAATPGATG